MRRFVTWIERWRGGVSVAGLLLGTLLFSFSLTPSLLPRSFVLQGILSGCAFAAGYGIGALLDWLWSYMGLKLPESAAARRIKWVIAVICMLVAVLFLYRAAAWQNSIRQVMGMGPIESAHPLRVALVAIVPAGVLILLGKLIAYAVRRVSEQLTKIVPPRVAFVVSVVVVAVLTGVLVNGVVLRNALYAADRFYAQLDAIAAQSGGAPADSLSSGSVSSLVNWETIGRDGRVYVETGPTREQIETVIGREAMDPLRVYVGLRSAESIEERAQLALAEMQRVGAFDRSILVLVMPVGTGWVDPAGMDTLEYLYAGDVASVAVQYSYLTSWLSLVIEPDYGTDTAQILFETVYDYWTALPRDTRPRLYLHGLSLGALGSQASMELYDILADPFQGALWVGPPFESETWKWATARRQAGTPQWLPRFGNGSSIRFTNQSNALDIAGARWGPVRIVFLQYASDPITFFETSSLYRAPEWMTGQRGPDVSPDLAWYPVVTFLQLGLDMALAVTSPVGYGHVYAPRDYIDAWVAVTDPPGWDPEGIEALKAALTE